MWTSEGLSLGFSYHGFGSRPCSTNIASVQILCPRLLAPASTKNHIRSYRSTESRRRVEKLLVTVTLSFLNIQPLHFMHVHVFFFSTLRGVAMHVLIFPKTLHTVQTPASRVHLSRNSCICPKFTFCSTYPTIHLLTSDRNHLLKCSVLCYDQTLAARAGSKVSVLQTTRKQT